MLSSRSTTRAFCPAHLSRRELVAGALALAGIAAPGRRVAAQTDAKPGATPGTAGRLSDALLRGFTDDIEQALETFQVPGAAVALVQGREISLARGFGLRDLASGAPVTPRTRFRVGSVTKSMTALLLATFADDGVVGWDDRVVDLWPHFRAPTAELTHTLRLRDLLGMGSGIAESIDRSLPVVEFFMMAGDVSARDALRRVADLPVNAAPGAAYSYNNTLVCVAAFVGLLAAGAPEDGLEAAYTTAMRERVFESLGMSGAAIAEDPRPLGDDYAAGYTRNLFGTPTTLPFVPLAGIAPAGSGLAGIEDLARFLIAMMSGGVSAAGSRIVSQANLAELFLPGIALDVATLAPPEFMPDTASLHYGMGWIIEEFRDGRQLVWHSGGIDGFATLVGFFPDEQIGFAVVANDDRTGAPFYLSVRASLLGRLFGLEVDLPSFLASVWPQVVAQTAELAATTQPVDLDTIQPFLGYYEEGFRLRQAGNDLFLEQGLHVMPLVALPDGDFLIADGPDVVQEARVAFASTANGVPVMAIEGFAPVRWLTGPNLG